MTHSIPPNINTLDRLSAVQFYSGTLGWAIHPLLAPDRGEPQERGKKPILKGWRGHNASEITPDFLTKYFANGSTHNVGCVVRAPFVHVDLDSKPDAGASVMAWLATQPELAAVPRERTGGGAHLAFICRDIPEDVMKAKKAPTCQINDKVSASTRTITNGRCAARGRPITPEGWPMLRVPTRSSSTNRKLCRDSAACIPIARPRASRI